MRILAARIVLAVLAASLTTWSLAQESFPSRPVKIIVPQPPGASSDTITRLLADELRKKLGQPVIVENRPGATGRIGMALLTKAPADGYTIGVGTEATHVSGPVMMKTLPYDPVKDFTPLTLAIKTSMVIAVNPAVLPVTSLRELVERSRQLPNGISYATPGLGSPQHLLGELIKMRTGARLTPVPYSGGAPAVNDLLAGHTPMAILTAPTLAAQASKINLIAVADDVRSPYLPNVPTISETIPGFSVSGWSAFFAPAGLPPAVTNTLSQALIEALRSPPLIAAMRREMMIPGGSTPAELEAAIQIGLERGRSLVAAGAIKQSD